MFRLGAHLGSARLVRTLTSPDLDTPTTVAFSAGRLWVVNARFNTLPTPTTAVLDHATPLIRAGARLTSRARARPATPPETPGGVVVRSTGPAIVARRCSRSGASPSTTAQRHGARRRVVDGAPRPAPRLPRAERRRQDDDDALHLRARRPRRPARCRWDGRPVDADMRLRFGYMPEQRGLYPRMRVGEQLAYFAQHHGLSGRDARARDGVWLERFGLADRAKSKLEDLSHGNQQRIQLATALVHDPELLVLDEPFSGLDPIGVATMTEVLRERAAAGVGVVFSSHQLDLVEEVCEDVVIVSRGRVVADGEIDALKAASGRRHLEVEVAGNGGAWLDGLGEDAGPRARRGLGEAPRRRARGPRRRSSRRPAGGRGPAVLVRAPAPVGAVHGGRQGAAAVGAEDAADEAPPRDPAGRHARDPRARPQPGLPAVARVHGVPARGGLPPAGAPPRPGRVAEARRSSEPAPGGPRRRPSRAAAGQYDVTPRHQHGARTGRPPRRRSATKIDRRGARRPRRPLRARRADRARGRPTSQIQAITNAAVIGLRAGADAGAARRRRRSRRSSRRPRRTRRRSSSPTPGSS